MLVIGHRGAAGLAPENTFEALQAGMEAGADILEFDIRLTLDNVPILVHDRHLKRTHGEATRINEMTLDELMHLTEGKKPIVTLEKVLDHFFGVILLNIELKGENTGDIVADLLKRKYIKRNADWGNIFLSSFKTRELRAVRRKAPYANLALLTNQNPFVFIAYMKSLSLSAVGFHRMHMHPFATEVAKHAGIFTYAYTVNRPAAALLLAEQGIDGVVTDYPDKILKDIKKKSA